MMVLGVNTDLYKGWAPLLAALGGSPGGRACGVVTLSLGQSCILALIYPPLHLINPAHPLLTPLTTPLKW